MATFVDLQDIINSQVDTITGPYKCYVANIFGPPPDPVHHKMNKVICGTSIEGIGKMCDHDPLRPEMHNYLYQFELLLFDAVSVGPPIKAMAFDMAHNLVGIRASHFHYLEEEVQTVFHIWMRTKHGDLPIVHIMEKASPTPNTRDVDGVHASVCKTPLGMHASSSMPMPSGGPHWKVTIDVEKKDYLWKSLLDTMLFLSKLDTTSFD